ncbi:MAG: 2-amino-4-hydroxy-6-hydroxymethyldihydropteridine diphosphokinase [Caldimicrobium sp.]
MSLPESVKKVYISLGTNLGDRLANIKKALKLLKALPLQIEKISSIYESEPLYYHSENYFYNLVLVISTPLSPFALFLELKKIEFKMGRQRTIELTDRPIDLDIVFYEDKVLISEILQIPHPRAKERAFVIVPACEISPHFRDPLSGMKLKEIYATKKELFEKQKLKKLSLEVVL